MRLRLAPRAQPAQEAPDADERYRAVLRLLLDGEKHKSGFVNLCEAQSLRNADLAPEADYLWRWRD